jgi:hypothetical protein
MPADGFTARFITLWKKTLIAIVEEGVAIVVFSPYLGQCSRKGSGQSDSFNPDLRSIPHTGRVRR